MERVPEFNGKEEGGLGNENPVEIPEGIIAAIEKYKKEMADPDLSVERFKELNEEHRRKMAGDSDNDLYYQLQTYRNMDAQGGEGIGIRIHQIEEILRQRTGI